MRRKKLIIASAVVLAAGITVFALLYWHLYIVNYAQLSLHQSEATEDGEYLINVQNISTEAMQENPKLGRVFAQVTEKYNKMVTEDCARDEEYSYYTRDGEYCDPLHYTQTTISLTPEELESLVQRSGIEYYHYTSNHPGYVRMLVWETSLKMECQHYPDGRVGISPEDTEKGQQQYCYYYIWLTKVEDNFLKRLLMFGPK